MTEEELKEIKELAEANHPDEDLSDVVLALLREIERLQVENTRSHEAWKEQVKPDAFGNYHDKAHKEMGKSRPAKSVKVPK